MARISIDYIKNHKNSRYINEKREIEIYHNSHKRTGKLIALIAGTAFGLTSIIMGLALNSQNKPAQSMLIPAALMGLSYGSIGRIERHYDRKREEDMEELRKRYKIKE